MTVVLATLLLTHWALAIVGMRSAKFFAYGTDTVTVMPTTLLLTHRADTDITMVAAKFVCT